MEERVRAKWRESSNERADGNADEWLHGLFEGAQQAAENAIKVICKFEGYKALYVDFAYNTLQKLYIPSARNTRVDECIIEPLNSVLGAMIDQLPDDLREYVADGFMDATLHLWERIVLDGGPLRAYDTQDVDYLEEDLSMLESFFIADGEGLDEQHVKKRMTRLNEILTLMSLETDVLISNLERLKQTHKPTQEGSEAKAPAEDADVILKILCHRADRNASKYLKEHGIRKRVREGFQLM